MNVDASCWQSICCGARRMARSVLYARKPTQAATHNTSFRVAVGSMMRISERQGARNELFDKLYT
eukprot:3963371-Amphidinium_carterae.1